ncbi:MAG: molybdopterin molybdotransferase MoeA [Alphaproteobacteria bacterium GM202ARS2]|nr:molybdopterin molybdotransferase MoeA [Alphaproteobacteria bacterium GM202ARS2]
MLSLQDALAQAHEALRPLYARTRKRTDTVAVADGYGRVLATAVRAPHDNPRYDVSAMDGYAVRSQDTHHPPTTLTLVGESKAGDTAARAIKKEQAMRIYTGAIMPKGADAVLIQENAECKGDAVMCPVALAPETFVRQKASDYRKGQRLLADSVVLDDRHIGLLASLNQSRLKVVAKPRIGVLSTGDELTPVGVPLASGRIVASTLPALLAFVEQQGGVAHDLGLVKDDTRALNATLQKAKAHCDCVVTTGGVSVGAYDVVARWIQDYQARLIFNRVAVKPGKPTTLALMGALTGALKDGLPILGLPGNAVSALVCARLFLRPLMDGCLGVPSRDVWQSLPLAESLAANGQREHYMRGKLVQQGRAVRAWAEQDSALLATLASSHVLIRRAAHAPVAKKGSHVDVMRLGCSI